MPTYVYETVPEDAGEEPKVYEIRQRMSDAPLKKHPATGERIRRVITADRGISGFASPDCGTDCGIPGSGGGCCCPGGGES
jgi:predicted nucleic acid-binding Zn ribbon protein